MFFSVVMPVYNRERHVGRSVASVLGQAFDDYELILVDDCSTDSSLTMMRSFEAPNVKVIARNKSGGAGAARNTGIAAARGEWIVLLDSDDELVPGALATLSARASGAPDTIEG